MRISHNLKTEVMTDFNYHEGTFKDLKKTILVRIKRMFPMKQRILKFLSSTRQTSDQSLTEFFGLAHKQARESGLHNGTWSKNDIESLIIMNGMRDSKQLSEVPFEHKNNEKISFEQLMYYANTHEGIDAHKTKHNGNKPGATVNSIKGKSKP